MAEIDHLQVARDVLAGNDLMTIAAATLDGDPWAFAVRNRGFIDGRVRWSSDPERYHSKLIDQNAKIAFLLYDSSPRIEDVAKPALYGRATVDVIEPDNIEGNSYAATVTEAWVLVSEKVDGVWRPKVAIDPSEIGNIEKS